MTEEFFDHYTQGKDLEISEDQVRRAMAQEQAGVDGAEPRAKGSLQVSGEMEGGFRR